MYKKIYFKLYLITILFLFIGCNWLGVKSQKVITMNEFEKILECDFKKCSDFLKIFPKSVEDLNERVKLIKEITQIEIEKILNIKKEDRSFLNTAYAYDKLKRDFYLVLSASSFLEYVMPDDKMREACHERVIELNAFFVEIVYKYELKKAFEDYVNLNMQKESLNAEEKYYIEELFKEFKRVGLLLPEVEYKKAQNILKEIIKIESEFSKNINTDKSKIFVDKQELDGLSEEFIKNLQKDQNGKYIIGCDYPTIFEIFDNCSVSETRKKVYFMFYNRAYPQNIKILDQMIQKRDQFAVLLGFESYADLDIDALMAKTPKKVNDFLSDICRKVTKKWDEEFLVLKNNLPERVKLDSNNDFYLWDLAFTENQYKKKFFNVDEREIAEYFPVENTLTKIFEIYQKFLSLTFKPEQVSGLWHKDVKVIQVIDNKTDKSLGYLILDLYPRENKFPHACMYPIISPVKRLEDKNSQIPAVVAVIANFPKATSEKPALMKHNDVETFFHEFGHTMHGFLGKTEMTAFSGTSVKCDFVEVPSQMFEEWLWDKDILKYVSSHYKTGKSLPDALIDKKIKLKNFCKGGFVLKQCISSFISLNYFEAGEKKDTDLIIKNLYQKYLRHMKYEPALHRQASFGHLNGYSAHYYSYLWSKVYSLDLFYEIKKHGLMNPSIGKKLTDLILSKGGSVDPELLLKDFLGREPNNKAFLLDLGIDN